MRPTTFLAAIAFMRPTTPSCPRIWRHSRPKGRFEETKRGRREGHGEAGQKALAVARKADQYRRGSEEGVNFYLLNVWKVTQ